ncbi:MAG TPA: beta-L-arabinofuranosidase domain-containing protein [Longimicrobiales bacterium]|nr:beta-L-arabinofuranosidase domain-containing protein [Longimicrobiales bacterium]
MALDSGIPRRDFLKAAPAAAAILAVATRNPEASAGQTPYPEIGAARYTPVGDYPIRAKRFSEVVLKDDFWRPKVAANAEVTIPLLVQRTSEFRGLNANVLEAAIYSLQTHPTPQLKTQVEERVRALSANAREREGNSNSGFEVAVAYYQATGKRDLLDAAIGTAQRLYDDFRVNRPPFSGGERDATNCLQLYRVTRDKKHLDLAKHYLDIRGLENSVNRSRHNPSYKPVLEQSEAVGHAVNGVTLMVSLADVGVLTGLQPYLAAAQRMWADAVSRKLYITGGVGATGNEGFGEPYVLPNVSAYAETCAVLMFMTLNHRLFLASGDSKYIDVLERGLYNNALSGVSAAGDRFFYVNRLASAGDGRDTRWERASLECCPPNLVRFLASMPGYIYAQDARAIYVNLYISSEASFRIGERDLKLSLESELPWGGKSAITIASTNDVRGSIKLRVPGWARNQPAPGSLYAYTDRMTRPTTVAINGQSVAAVPDQLGYITLDREWRNGDRIDVEFPVEIRKVTADERVRENHGRMAIERGPIVYCVEWPDCADGAALDLLFDAGAQLTPRTERELLGGIAVIETTARSLTKPGVAAKPVRLIPYYLWANRGAGQMSVWLSTREYQPGDVGPAGGLIFYVNPNFATDGWRYLEAAPFDQSAGAKWGCFRRAIEGARGTAVGTGKQNTADILAACNEPGIAAALCANLTLNGFHDWFLTSRDELALVYQNLMMTGVSDFGTRGIADNFVYWTSSQQTADMANHIDFADLGRLHYDDKDFPRRVRAIRAF